ncbi:MAG: PAS domain S-box protein [Nitrospirota bacterium]
MHQTKEEHRTRCLVVILSSIVVASVIAGAYAGFSLAQNIQAGIIMLAVLVLLVPLLSYGMYRMMLYPSYRRLEDANLELHLKQEELLDTKDDLFIKFLGIYDVNYAANSPRLFSERLKDVTDVTARVMEADACFLYLYDAKNDELLLAATNIVLEGAIGKTRIPLGTGIEGWVGRRLEPAMLKDFHSDSRYHEIPGLPLEGYLSLYCLPLYVYSNGSLVGLIEVFYRKTRTFTDEEINFFTTLSGIISTTVQNEHMQAELRKMNLELEQWIAEKTEEFRSSEERYRNLVENASEAIFVLAENGDIVFANDQAARLTGYAKYDLLHKNLFELLDNTLIADDMLSGIADGRLSLQYGKLRTQGGTVIPVDIRSVRLSLMGKKFIQSVLHDMSYRLRLEALLQQKEEELSALKMRLNAPS